MPDSPISDLASATAFSGTEVFPLDQGGVTVKGTIDQAKTYISSLSATSANNLSFFAATTSLQLKGVISDETGSGALAFADTPTLVTPVLGVATATSINKVTLTAPASGSTLTIINGKTLTVNNSIALTGTDSTVMTFPTTTATIARTDSAQTFTGVQTFSSAPIHSTATAGRIPYYGASKDILDTANLLWDNSNSRLSLGGATSTSGNDVYLQKTVNGVVGITIQNASTGTGGLSRLSVQNSGTDELALYRTSTGFTTAGIEVANQGVVYNSAGSMIVANAGSTVMYFAIGGLATTNVAFQFDGSKNVICGNAAIATNATDGFLYVPTCAGTPTGAPTAVTGRCPIVADSTNNKLYLRSGGAWVALN